MGWEGSRQLSSARLPLVRVKRGGPGKGGTGQVRATQGHGPKEEKGERDNSYSSDV